MGYIVAYVKITDDKNGIIMHDPKSTTIRRTISEAEHDAKRLTNESRTYTIIPRIYYIHDITDIESVLTEAKQYFKSVYDNMIEAKEVLSRPTSKRRRRKKTNFAKV